MWPGAQAGAPVTEDVLKLGLLLPITGSWEAGRTIPGAAALAVQRINADPSLLGGMRVEFVFEDVGCGTYRAVLGVQKLLSDPKIDAVFGPGMQPCMIVSAANGAVWFRYYLFPNVQGAKRLAKQRCDASRSIAAGD